MAVQRFDFAFDPAFRALLSIVGINPRTAWVAAGDEGLVVRFGPWRLETGLDNVTSASVTGAFRWYRVLGPRLSLADRGVTFGTTSRGGVCVDLQRPVPGLAPFGWLAHPNLTVTVAEPAALVAALEGAEPRQ